MAYPFLPVNPCCTDVVINDPCGCSSVISNSGCNNNNPCSTILTASSTIVYDGPALSCIIAEPCDTLNVILQKIDSIICNLLTQINTLNIQVSNITTQILNLNSEVIIISNSLDQCCNVTTTTTSSTSTSTTTSTTTVAPAICENFSLTNTGVDPVAIIITDCVTQVESAIVLLPGDTDICVITDSPLVVPGTIIVVPNGPCFVPTTTTTSSSTSTTTSTTSTSSTTTTTTTAIPCECLTFNNTDKLDHSFSYINCNNDLVELIPILAGEILSVCGCCAIANNELVTISIGANCSDGLCPTPTTTTTTTGFPCDCLTFENPDAYVHNIGYTNCSNGIITGINIDPSQIISVCGSNGTVSDPLVTITVGGVCIEGVCQTTTTTTTCNSAETHDYAYQTIRGTNLIPDFISSLVDACSSQICLQDSTCSIDFGYLVYFNVPVPGIGDICYSSTIGCIVGLVNDGYYIIDYSGTYTIVEIVNSTIVSFPICPA